MQMPLTLLLAIALVTSAAAQDFRVCTSVPVYEPCEIHITVATDDLVKFPNPYASVILRAEFRSPKGGRTKVIPAFWNSDNRFVLRFAPDFEGRWDFRLISNIPSLDKKTASFQASPARSAGFIEVFNIRYFKHPLPNIPHYWLGGTLLNLSTLPWDEFREIVDQRAKEKFTHLRGLILGPPGNAAKVFPTPDQPSIEHFQELDRRIAYINSKDIIADLLFASSGEELSRLFPTRRFREEFIRYICARYAGYNITWQGLQEWESHPSSRTMLQQLATALDKYDPYSHPKSTGAAVSSATLAADEWQDYYTQNRFDPALASIEYEAYPAPFINTGVGRPDDAGLSNTDTTRKQAWNAAVRGHYVTLADSETANLNSIVPGQLTRLHDFFAQTRYFDLLPHYRIIGGAALALQLVPWRSERLVGVEYIVYAEKPGLIEVVMPKHGYSISWFNPVDGAWFDQKKKFKGDRYRSNTPDDLNDWVLYIRREGKKQDFNNSFILESKPLKSREIEHSVTALPFEIQMPEQSQLVVGQKHAFNATLKKNTIAAKRMLWLWTAELAGSDLGTQFVASTQSGTFNIPDNFAPHYPATLSLRVIGLDGAGRLFEAFKLYTLHAPE